MNRLAITSAALAIACLTPLCSCPHAGARPLLSARVCAAAAVGFATCDAQILVGPSGAQAAGKATASTEPTGFGPADIRSAYALSATAGSGKTVAIVDAYDDPTAQSDLAVYRKTFGLSACTGASGCFRKVNQSGGAALPKADAGWAVETSLDLDMVTAACGSCKILLVEATTSSMVDLAAGVSYAATQKVSAISNSYSSADTTQSAAYNHPGIAIVASTGDAGYGLGAPASFDSVIAVGGTTLKRASTTKRGWSETAWKGAGSGCSTLNSKPSWQTAATGCAGKASADVSAVADPSTGVAVYDSTTHQGAAGWLVGGGTSAAAPIIAAVYAMSGNTAGYPASYTWTHTGGLNDVTAGTNGTCPKATSKWCTAGAGWDGPTGLGTPNGIGSF
jgi:subtilase family serine protease